MSDGTLMLNDFLAYLDESGDASLNKTFSRDLIRQYCHPNHPDVSLCRHLAHYIRIDRLRKVTDDLMTCHPKYFSDLKQKHIKYERLDVLMTDVTNLPLYCEQSVS